MADSASSRREVPETFGAYVRGKELGSGASGFVFTCTHATNKKVYASKAIDLKRMRLSPRADRELKKLQREIEILKLLPPHPRLVKFIDGFEEGDWFYLILEYVGGGDLFSALIKRSAPNRKPSFTEAEAAYVLRQLVDGLGFLHEQGVIHRDLKLENILVVSERKRGADILCEVKIADFGLSKVVGDGLSEARSTVGTARYIAPEVFAKGVLHDFRADYWSLGVLLFLLLAGYFPAEGPEVPQPKLNDTVAGLDVSAAAKAIVLGLLQVEREKRMTLGNVQKHPWLELGHDDDGCGTPSRPPSKKPCLEPVPTVSLFGSEDDSVEVIESPKAAPAPVKLVVATPAPRRLVLRPNTNAAKAGGLTPPMKEKTSRTPVASAQAIAAVAQTAGSSTAAATVDLTPPTPKPEPELLSVEELDRLGASAAVQGTILFRYFHKTGGGFMLRIGDNTGMIDVRFWDEAARRFKADPALGKGAVVRLAGFCIVALKPKDLPYAPSGRRHSLHYSTPEEVHFKVLSATGKAVAP